MSSTGEILWTSIGALIPVFLIILTGIQLVRKNVLNRAGIRTMTQLVTLVFIPCTFFIRLAQQVSVELFRTTWVLSVGGVAVTFVNFAIAMLVLVPLGSPEPTFKSWFILAQTFPNLVALPLVFVASLCRQADIRRPGVSVAQLKTPNMTDEDKYLSASECFELGETYVFMYILFPTIMMFSVTYLMRSKKTKKQEVEVDVGEKEQGQEKQQEQRQQQDETSCEMVEFALEDGANGEPPTGDGSTNISEARSETTQFPGSFRRPPAALTPDFLAPDETNAQGVSDKKKNLGSKIRKVLIVVWAIFWQPTVCSQILSIVIGLITPLKEWLFDPNTVAAPFIALPAILAPALVPLTNLSLASSLGVKLQQTPLKNMCGAEGSDISKRTTFTFVMGRMILAPGICYAILYAILNSLPEDQLLQIIFFFETATPSANMCVVLAIQANCQRQAETLSLGMSMQYIIGMFSLTLYCFLALTITS